jgi:hypothetical protein
VGAIERIEGGGALRVLEALFVGSDPDTGELAAVDLKGDSGGIVAPLLGFRLDSGERRRATERTLSPEPGRVPAHTLREIGEALEPGAAMVAVLVEHRWTSAFDDAVERTGGAALADAFVESTSLADLGPELLAAATRRRGRAETG